MRTTRFSLLGMVGLVLAAACGGEGGHIIDPPPPPPPTPETVTVSQNLTNGSTITTITPYVSVNATPVSSKTQIGDAGVSWTVNGVSVATGRIVSVKLSIGANRVCVKAQGLEKSAESCVDVTFNPTFACKIVMANPDNESLGSANFNINFSHGTNTASRSVASNGDCSMAGLITQEDSLKVVITTASGSSVAIPSIGYVSKADMAQGLTLIVVPGSWKIPTGSFSSQVVPIDLSLAYKPNNLGSSFYSRFEQGGRWFYTIRSFPGSSLPTPAAVHNGLSSTHQVIDQAGEAGIWADVDRLETALGWKVLRKVAATDITYPNGVVLVADSTKTGGAPAMAGPYASGNDLTGGKITFYANVDAPTVGNAAHELVHVLGFGHGCGWNGIMSTGCGYVHSNYATAQDVAYIQLMYRVRELERKYNTRFSLAEANVGQEVLQQHLPEKNVVKQ
jgi:hypothetical protein